MYKKAALVTGASGFLAQHFIEELSSSYRIIAVSRKRIELENIESKQINFSNDDAFLDLLLKIKPDYIFNFRACFGDNYKEAYQINTHFPHKILDFLSSYKLSSRVILVGSAAEYGFKNLDVPLKEEDPLKPVTIYGLTKAMQSLLPNFYRYQGSNVVYARIFNLYGPNISLGLLPGILNNKIPKILNGELKKVKLGPLDDIYDFIHVKDAIQKIKTVAELGKNGNIYNIGSGNPCLVRDFVKKQLKPFNLSYNEVIEETPRNSLAKRKIVYACTKKIEQLYKSKLELI